VLHRGGSIGVHVGDVMIKSGDLFGDGVNIAAYQTHFSTSEVDRHCKFSQMKTIRMFEKIIHIRVCSWCEIVANHRHPRYVAAR
jgi:hypothetical protein